MTRPTHDGSVTVQSRYPTAADDRSPFASSVARAAKARYRRLGPTGFLHPVSIYAVKADGRERHAGRNRRDAERAFKTWCRIAPEKHIQLLQNTTVINERQPLEIHV